MCIRDSYIGMGALRVQGQIGWDNGIVVASLAIGTGFAWAALIARRRLRRWGVPVGTLLFTLAICGLHFTAMSAAGIVPDPRIIVPTDAMRSDAVSYTHLDVYKRQAMDRGSTRSATAASSAMRCGPTRRAGRRRST